MAFFGDRPIDGQKLKNIGLLGASGQRMVPIGGSMPVKGKGGTPGCNEGRRTAAGQGGHFENPERRGTPGCNEGLPTAAGRGGGDTPGCNEGQPQLRARAAGTHLGATRAGTRLQVMAARSRGSSYIGDGAPSKFSH